MQEYQTKINLYGNDYPAVIAFEWDDTHPLIYSVEICKSTQYNYNNAGEYAPHVEITNFNIMVFLDSTQIAALADEIRADAVYQQEEARIDAWIMRQEDRFSKAA